MRRRYGDMTPPPELVTSNGHRYATEAEWVEAYQDWCDAREQWLSQRGLSEQVLPKVVDGGCPFDYGSI